MSNNTKETNDSLLDIEENLEPSSSIDSFESTPYTEVYQTDSKIVDLTKPVSLNSRYSLIDIPEPEKEPEPEPIVEPEPEEPLPSEEDTLETEPEETLFQKLSLIKEEVVSSYWSKIVEESPHLNQDKYREFLSVSMTKRFGYCIFVLPFVKAFHGYFKFEEALITAYIPSHLKENLLALKSDTLTVKDYVVVKLTPPPKPEPEEGVESEEAEKTEDGLQASADGQGAPEGSTEVLEASLETAEEEQEASPEAEEGSSEPVEEEPEINLIVKHPPSFLTFEDSDSLTIKFQKDSKLIDPKTTNFIKDDVWDISICDNLDFDISNNVHLWIKFNKFIEKLELADKFGTVCDAAGSVLSACSDSFQTLTEKISDILEAQKHDEYIRRALLEISSLQSEHYFANAEEFTALTDSLVSDEQEECIEILIEDDDESWLDLEFKDQEQPPLLEDSTESSTEAKEIESTDQAASDSNTQLELSTLEQSEVVEEISTEIKDTQYTEQATSEGGAKVEPSRFKTIWTLWSSSWRLRSIKQKVSNEDEHSKDEESLEASVEVIEEEQTTQETESAENLQAETAQQNVAEEEIQVETSQESSFEEEQQPETSLDSESSDELTTSTEEEESKKPIPKKKNRSFKKITLKSRTICPLDLSDLFNSYEEGNNINSFSLVVEDKEEAKKAFKRSEQWRHTFLLLDKAGGKMVYGFEKGFVIPVEHIGEFWIWLFGHIRTGISLSSQYIKEQWPQTKQNISERLALRKAKSLKQKQLKAEKTASNLLMGIELKIDFSDEKTLADIGGFADPVLNTKKPWYKDLRERFKPEPVYTLEPTIKTPEVLIEEEPEPIVEEPIPFVEEIIPETTEEPTPPKEKHLFILNNYRSLCSVSCRLNWWWCKKSYKLSQKLNSPRFIAFIERSKVNLHKSKISLLHTIKVVDSHLFKFTESSIWLLASKYRKIKYQRKFNLTKPYEDVIWENVPKYPPRKYHFLTYIAHKEHIERYDSTKSHLHNTLSIWYEHFRDHVLKRHYKYSSKYWKSPFIVIKTHTYTDTSCEPFEHTPFNHNYDRMFIGDYHDPLDTHVYLTPYLDKIPTLTSIEADEQSISTKLLAVFGKCKCYPTVADQFGNSNEFFDHKDIEIDQCDQPVLHPVRFSKKKLNPRLNHEISHISDVFELNDSHTLFKCFVTQQTKIYNTVNQTWYITLLFHSTLNFFTGIQKPSTKWIYNNTRYDLSNKGILFIVDVLEYQAKTRYLSKQLTNLKERLFTNKENIPSHLLLAKTHYKNLELEHVPEHAFNPDSKFVSLRRYWNLPIFKDFKKGNIESTIDIYTFNFWHLLRASIGNCLFSLKHKNKVGIKHFDSCFNHYDEFIKSNRSLVKLQHAKVSWFFFTRWLRKYRYQARISAIRNRIGPLTLNFSFLDECEHISSYFTQKQQLTLFDKKAANPSLETWCEVVKKFNTSFKSKDAYIYTQYAPEYFERMLKEYEFEYLTTKERECPVISMICQEINKIHNLLNEQPFPVFPLTTGPLNFLLQDELIKINKSFDNFGVSPSKYVVGKCKDFYPCAINKAIPFKSLIPIDTDCFTPLMAQNVKYYKKLKSAYKQRAPYREVHPISPNYLLEYKRFEQRPFTCKLRGLFNFQMCSHNFFIRGITAKNENDLMWEVQSSPQIKKLLSKLSNDQSCEKQI